MNEIKIKSINQNTWLLVMMACDDAKVYGVLKVLQGKKWCESCLRACWEGAQGDCNCVRQYWILEASDQGGGAGWPIQLGCSIEPDYLRERNTWRHSLNRMERKWGSCSLHFSSHQGGTALHTGQHSPAEGHYCPLWRTIPGGPHVPHIAQCWCVVGWVHLRESHCGSHSGQQKIFKNIQICKFWTTAIVRKILHNTELLTIIMLDYFHVNL